MRKMTLTFSLILPVRDITVPKIYDLMGPIVIFCGTKNHKFLGPKKRPRLGTNLKCEFRKAGHFAPSMVIERGRLFEDHVNCILDIAI